MPKALLKKIIVSASVLFCIGPGLVQATDTPLAARLKAVAGGSPTMVKVVYTKLETRDALDFPTDTWKTNEFLMGIRSDVGVEETLQTTKSNYQNPLITHDGQHVVYTTITAGVGTTFMVDWTRNSTPRTIAGGMTSCLWFDTATGKEYAICAKNCGLSGSSFSRIDLSDTTNSAVMFTVGSPAVTQWIRVSADGKAYSGCLGPFSSGDMEVRYCSDNSPIGMMSGGCWASMPYDNSYRFVRTTGDHDKWQIMGPGMTTPLELLDGVLFFTSLFSQDRMASYIPNLFLLVDNAVNSDEGTGDIYIVRTDSSLQHIQDTATVTSGANSHFADIWASSVPGTGVKLKPTRVAPTPKSGPVEYYSISGRRVFVAANEKSGRIFGRLSTGVYITVGGAGNRATVRIVSAVK